MTNLNIASMNARGLGGQQKRRDVLHYLKNMKFDIIFLQDTHLIAEKITFFDSLWKGKAYHSCYTNNSRGTSILLDRNLQHTVLFEFYCERGNYVILGCKIGSDTYVLGSIYGPNRDEPEFYRRIDELLDGVDCDHTIIGGDFNFVMNPAKDCYGYARENNVNARNKFSSVCDQHRLIDVWRQYNVEDDRYTWTRSTPNQGARLDMFFISDHLCSLCVEQNIIPGYRTDHSIISIGLKIGESRRGPGLWKFNESLLSDEGYIKAVEECIERIVEQYSLPIYLHSFLANPCNYKDIEFQIEDDLFYETLLMMIRGETVKFSKQKVKQAKEKERKLMLKVENAQEQHDEDKTEQSAFRLQKCKEDLENARKPLIEGLIVRSRTKWHEEGERSSKYFLGLEKRNAMRKSVVSLKTDEHILTRTSSILQAFTDNLSSKYSKQHIMPTSADVFIRNNTATVLSDQERDVLDLPLSYD